jgi:hypothetical protein
MGHCSRKSKLPSSVNSKLEPILETFAKLSFTSIINKSCIAILKYFIFYSKPENILLTKMGEAKLCDFGFAAILGERKTLCGTY